MTMQKRPFGLYMQRIIDNNTLTSLMSVFSSRVERICRGRTENEQETTLDGGRERERAGEEEEGRGGRDGARE